ncbi:Esterase/lipase [Paramagnetospirillum magnetotacticum MS-1]|uniref:Esterase/lipase n=1 Tax=Paramagnetospirillum magnetotacticum MS-1 TaxID=272627 RepID=A0A0C2V1R8_PARME|nr:alpha/beta hydrolase [Paramagnetospirillum magnetotacticum]KIL99031.1 Esterase/lipase [Paramagnetospirillum magnetotacticum MS-1]
MLETGFFSLGTPGRLDADLEFILAKVAELKLPKLYELGPVGARTEFALRLSRSNPPAPHGVEAEDITIAGIPARRYQPQGGPKAKAMLLYFHGGGFVVGDLETHDPHCRALAAESGSVVVALHYRLGPEHPYPAAIQDGIAALKWAAAEYAGWTLGVAGDSAGGTLSAVVALHARDLNIPLALQMLIYPAVDQKGDFPSRTRLADGYLLTQGDIEWFTQQYFVGHEGPVLEPDASPLRAASHGGLAPALVLTCGFDPLVDEGDAYAQALIGAGVPVRHVRLEGSIHGCLGLAGYVASGRQALAEVCGAWRSVQA